MTVNSKKIGYRDAGVNIDAGNQTVELIKSYVAGTKRPGVLGGVGGFGGLFALEPGKYREPVLVSGTDGVGTKLRIAVMLDRHDTIGIDAVAMCVNDILVQGAEPLFFLDYLAAGKLKPEKAAEVVKGIAEGCRQAGCALIGGETAEMPGFYAGDDYDVAGFAVGIVERERLVDGSQVQPGDKVLGLPSSGLHSNGYSLARKILLEKTGYQLDQELPGLNSTLGQELLKPTKIYVSVILPLLAKFKIKGMAHITGGGLLENLPRVFAGNLDAEIKAGTWPVLPIFHLIAQVGPVAEVEMYRTFNMGIGFVIIVGEEETEAVMEYLRTQGQAAYVIGRIVHGTGKALIKDNRF